MLGLAAGVRALWFFPLGLSGAALAKTICRHAALEVPCRGSVDV
jgi:hypothetical protein